MLVFGRFALRMAERLLLVDNQPVALGARAFDVLQALAERSDRVVSKAELLDLAWPGLVVEENNLTVQISALRRLLGHEAIATVTGRGYRLTLARPDSPAAKDTGNLAPSAGRLQRRLAAVVQADVMGWARMVERDAPGAARAWRRVRLELVERSLQQYSGRATEVTAERVLVEFGSAVDAVDWAQHLQAALAALRQGGQDDARALHMRIGIAVDDVIVDDGKLVGDGVNLAADLQLSAGHDEVLVTQKVRDFAAGKSEVQFEPLGERLLRRTRRPMQVLRALAAEPEPRVPAAVRQPVQQATVAVLPFGVDAATEPYLGDGMTEEIISALSLNRALFVIAHGSTLRYRGRQDMLADAADELGVRYLLTGSVRRANDQLRIFVTLLHAADERILWQQRYDGNTGELFAFQSEIAASVAAAVAPSLQDEEVARLRQRPTGHDGAYDCVLRALAGMGQLGTPAFDDAGRMLHRAIALDAGYAQAHAHLAWWYSLRSAEGRTDMFKNDVQLALDHALRAEQLDPRDAWVLSVAGYMVSLQQKKHPAALEMFDRALAINPSCAAAWARSGATLMYLGRADEAITRIQHAIKLSPFDQHQFWHFTICGGACFVARRYDEAVAWLGKALRLNPRFNGARRFQIGALVRAGALEEARALAQALLADIPGFTVQQFSAMSALHQPALDDLMQALHSAGLPP